MPTLPDYMRLDLPSPPAERPYVLVNMVASADGKIVIEGTERGLGSEADQRLMRALRCNVDAVLNGASTLRQSGSSPALDAEALRAYRRARGLAETPLAVVLSRSGDLPLDAAFFTDESFEALVAVTDATPEERRRAIADTGRPVEVVRDASAVPDLLRLLRERYGVRTLLCEGGAALNGSLFDAAAVDELFLTLAPRIVGGNAALTPVRGERPPSFTKTWSLALVSAISNAETGEVYVRYRVAREPGVQP